MNTQFIIYPIQKVYCCNNRVIITTNDGNRYQRCQNCSWYWRAPEKIDN
jgi:hypothetical protein